MQFLFQYTAYHNVAEGFGACGYVLTAENKDEIDKIFEKTLSAPNQNNNSVLINVHIGKSDFRAGSISI